VSKFSIFIYKTVIFNKKTINIMTERIARFNELTPSTLPFVEGRIEGHKERKNYSIVGPGVAEDSQQSVKISKPHGYNLGAVSANPKNGSGLTQSHNS
jgi:hypothetical protein